MKQRFLQTGFSVIEVLIVFAIIAVMVGVAMFGFQNYAHFQRYEQEVGVARTALYAARADARGAVGDEAHGIKVLGNSLVLFSGDNYVMGDPSNETITFNVTSLTHTFSGGVDEIVFRRLTGVPSATGTITLTGVNYGGSSVIEISGTGVIQ